MKKLVSHLGRTLEIVTWKDIRQDVLAVNKELVAIVDDISPGNDYKFVRARYLFGDIFIKNGIAYFPDQSSDELVSILDSSIDPTVKKELAYCTMPLFISIEKDNEAFIGTNSRDIPINLFHKGSFSGVYEAMDFMMGIKPTPIWSYAAGSRSIFMLPKITDKLGLKKLRTLYNIPTTIFVKQLSEHWELFKNISRSKNFSQPWTNKILYFGEKWLVGKDKSPCWKKFRDYMFKEIWHQASFSINKLKFNLSWEKFAEVIFLRRLQPKPYLFDQVKHILSIVSGNFPAFRPMDDSQEAAPTKGIQEAFVEIYSLRQYLPTLLNVVPLDDPIKKKYSAYYSLSYPTVLEGSPLKKTSSTIISDMREIKLIIETLRKHLPDKNYWQETDIMQNLQIDYYHNEIDACNEIALSSVIPDTDPDFLIDKKNFPNKDFCWPSSFFSGCIRIARLNNSQK